MRRFHELLENEKLESSPRLLVKKLVALFKERFDLCVEGVWLLKDEENLVLYQSSRMEAAELPPDDYLDAEENLFVDDGHCFYVLSDSEGKIGAISFYTPSTDTLEEVQELFEPLIPLISSYFRRLEKWVTTARHELYDFGQTETLSKELFQTSQGLEEVWDTLAKTVYGMFECDDCRLFLRKSERELVLRGQYPLDEQKGTAIAVGEDPLIQSVIDEGKAVLINNLPQQDEDDRSTRGIRSFLAVPFRYQDYVMGTINLSSETPHIYTSEDLEKLTRFCDNLATVYHNTEEFANLTSYVEKLLSNLPVGVVDVRLKTSEVVLNEKAANLLNFQEKVTGRDDFEDFLTGVKGGGELLELMYEPGLDSPSGPKRIELDSGDFYPTVVSTSSTPLKDVEGELSGILLVLTDVTEQQMLNRQINRQERLAALGELASSLAHEIKNPLTSIIGFTQLIPQRCEDVEFLKKMAKIVGQESSRLNSLVENLLSFGKPQVGNRSLVEVGDIINDIYVLLNKRIDKQEVDFSNNIPEGLTVYGDPLKLKQIFLNLALNALDALEKGGQLEISGKTIRDSVIIEVTDTGSGIESETLSRIFNPFFTTRKEGTGLGLAITHRIVEEHDGEIRVDSTPGEGTKMQVFLPGSQPDSSEKPEEDE
jgi:signal transduction histidine kinase/putative methionine-R-sulfoxide reductase with GAF domain